MSAPHVVVIGGGLAGLAASAALADEKYRVTLLERHPRLGGRATSYALANGECIDNCQHVTLRCCTNLEDFYRRIGVEKAIRYYNRLTFSDSKAHRAEIRSCALPAPLHLVPSFITFPLLNWKDKRSIARAMLRIVRGGKLDWDGRLSMLEWLQRNNQTSNAIDRFWRVVLVSALNEELDRIDAEYGIAVFWKAFLATPAGFGVGIPVVPLSDLYTNCSERIRHYQGEVRTRCGVSELRTRNNEVVAVGLDDESEMTGDYYIAAVSFDRLAKLLPGNLRSLDFFSRISKLHSSPITSVHMWLDRVVMTEAFLASVDQTVQWVFNKTMLRLDEPPQPGQYLQAVISASHALSELSQQDVVDLCRKEMSDLFPQFAAARLVRSVVVRESAATFSPAPGCDEWRLETLTPVRNLFLAGDWTQTGWPATMESAVRSGYQAAEAILRATGNRRSIVRSELRPTGLSGWLTRRP